jgi:hypothetical protein
MHLGSDAGETAAATKHAIRLVNVDGSTEACSTRRTIARTSPSSPARSADSTPSRARMEPHESQKSVAVTADLARAIAERSCLWLGLPKYHAGSRYISLPRSSETPIEPVLSQKSMRPCRVTATHPLPSPYGRTSLVQTRPSIGMCGTVPSMSRRRGWTACAPRVQRPSRRRRCNIVARRR